MNREVKWWSNATTDEQSFRAPMCPTYIQGTYLEPSGTIVKNYLLLCDSTGLRNQHPGPLSNQHLGIPITVGAYVCVCVRVCVCVLVICKITSRVIGVYVTEWHIEHDIIFQEKDRVPWDPWAVRDVLPLNGDYSTTAWHGDIYSPCWECFCLVWKSKCCQLCFTLCIPFGDKTLPTADVYMCGIRTRLTEPHKPIQNVQSCCQRFTVPLQLPNMLLWLTCHKANAGL